MRIQTFNEMMKEKENAETKISDDPEIYYMGISHKGQYSYRQVVPGKPDVLHVMDPDYMPAHTIILKDIDERENDAVSSNRRRILKINFDNKIQRCLQEEKKVESVDEATESVVERLKKAIIPAKTKCERCRGLGHYQGSNVFLGSIRTVQCAACKGTGTVEEAVKPIEKEGLRVSDFKK